MAGWTDRLRSASYRDPSGKEHTFDFLELSREVTLRGTVFEFPGIDGGYVQQQGHGPRKYPMRCVFAGGDFDLQVDAFAAGLIKPGVGVLSHPLYGDLQVVPFGDWSHREDLINEGNQSIVDVTFITSLGEAYPGHRPDAVSEIGELSAQYPLLAAEQLDSVTVLDNARRRVGVLATVRKGLETVRSKIVTAQELTADVRQEAQEYYDTINLAIDVLVGEPFNLAQAVVNLTLSPLRFLNGANSRMSLYASMFQELMSNAVGLIPTYSASTAEAQRQIVNTFHVNDLFVTAALIGHAISEARAGRVGSGVAAFQADPRLFRTRQQAINAAATIASMTSSLAAWRATAFTAFSTFSLQSGVYDTGAAFSAATSMSTMTVGHLVRSAFSLVSERTIILTGPRSVVDLCYELYGTTDALDFFIATNNFSGNDLLELPRGEVVVYYA